MNSAVQRNCVKVNFAKANILEPIDLMPKSYNYEHGYNICIKLFKVTNLFHTEV